MKSRCPGASKQGQIRHLKSKEEKAPTNDGNIVLRGLKLPEGNINSDTTLTLGLELVEHPSILERTLAEFGSFL
jgi:hypothetical protein